MLRKTGTRPDLFMWPGTTREVSYGELAVQKHGGSLAEALRSNSAREYELNGW